MQDIVDFVLKSMASSVVGNTVYEGLKKILGSSFNSLETLVQDNKKKESEELLKELLSNDEKLKKEIVELQNINIKINGNNSGNIVIGNENIFNHGN